MGISAIGGGARSTQSTDDSDKIRMMGLGVMQSGTDDAI